MKYDITIYTPAKTNKEFRFLLGNPGKKPLFVIGLNPSTADDKIPDHTLRKVMGYSDRNGFDSFVMMNLYAQRTPYPEELHDQVNDQLHAENVFHILSTLKEHNDISILAAWGETISERTFLKSCLADVFKKTQNKNITWLKIGNLTKTGHPRHPSRGAYQDLTKFDIQEYLCDV